jgi:5-methylthioadenosine/S-adenosylhomocysteine deaminase
MRYDIVITNGTIITVDDQFKIIENGLICVAADRIVRIGPMPGNGPLPDAKRTIDAEGGIILPGLVNTHTHLPMTLFRGLADDLPLKQWLEDVIFPAEAAHMTPENVRIGTSLACAEMMLSGTTTCCDGYFLEDEVAQTVADSGLRGVLGQGVMDFAAPGIGDPGDAIAVAERFAVKWRARSPLIRPSVFCHSLYACSAGTLTAAKRMADKHGLLFQIHVAETRTENENIREQHRTSPVGYLDRLGLIGPNCLLVHCVWIDDADMAVIAERKAAVSHNPESNMKLAAGIAPLTRMHTAGVTVGIGTDGCASNNTLDLFQAMDITAKLHKVHDMDSTAADARTILRMATRDGARAIGMEAEIGSLEVGKKADLIIVDICQPHLVPMYHPVSHAVYAAKGSDVKTVIIDGHPVVENRVPVHLNTAEIIERANSVASQIERHGQKGLRQ